MFKTIRTNAHPRLLNLIRNASIVFSGNVANAVIGLVYLAVLTRALTIEQFGTYALFGAYVALIGRLTSFQSWQGLIQYGTQALADNDKPLIYNLLCFGSLLDLASGVAGYLIAIGGAMLIPVWLGLGDSAVAGTAVAASILVFNWSSAPTALLRIYDRFVPQAVFQNIGSLLQLLTVVVLWVIGEDRLIVYLAATAINNVVGQIGFFWYAARVARRQDVLAGHGLDLGGLPGKCPGIWRFVFSTNADSMVRVLRDADIFIVNALLDVAAVGLYRIARTVTGALGKITGPFYQTIYPELSRMVAKGETGDMIRFMLQASMILGSLTCAAWLGFLVFGEYLLELAFSTNYVAAFTVTAWCMAGMIVWGIAQPLSPVIMALRKPELAFVIHLLTSLAYVALLTVFVREFELLGAGFAFLCFYVLWACAMFVVVTRQLQQARFTTA